MEFKEKPNYAETSELGKKTTYDSHYNPDKLYPISRQPKREEIGIHDTLPFYGVDIWNHYEVSWLNAKGKPVVAIAEIIFGCESKVIIESKSMKLYFNSLNNTRFKDIDEVSRTVEKDLTAHLQVPMLIRFLPLDAHNNGLSGINIDDLDITCDVYSNNPAFLTTEDEIVTETLCSDLLKSNCLVTNQPDWCSVQISYQGRKINREGLLKYIVSFRNDNEFHEQCIEKIFMHIMKYCKPQSLTVYGRSTRRGGLDINSYRSTEKVDLVKLNNERLLRQ